MQYFIDNNNKRWVYGDDASQEMIDQDADDAGVTFTQATEEEWSKPPVLSFEREKAMKIGRIDALFELLYKDGHPVPALGELWHGGYIAGAKYKAAVDLAELTGQTDVGFKDVSGTKHTLSLADAKTVLIAIGADYLAKDAQRDDYIAQAEAATSKAELDAIVISF